jgi:hypothetical protein
MVFLLVVAPREPPAGEEQANKSEGKRIHDGQKRYGLAARGVDRQFAEALVLG